MKNEGKGLSGRAPFRAPTAQKISMIERVKRAALARWAPASWYVRGIYRRKTGTSLDLDNPLTFNEKIQWLKLNYPNPVLTGMADKVEAKQFIRDRLGSDLSVPTAAVFDSADSICLADLPDAFALKATHGSGWNIICRDKSELNEEDVRAYFRHWLGKSYYLYSKEWAYKHVKPRVICEPLLIDEAGQLPMDYKVHCFSGRAKYIRVIKRHSEKKRWSYDCDWTKLPFSIDSPVPDEDCPRPARLKEMLEISEALSADLPFLRVDFFLVDGELFVGELTAYPANGMGRFTDEAWNRRIGEMLELPSREQLDFGAFGR